MTGIVDSSLASGLAPLDPRVEQLALEMAQAWQQGRRPLAEELLARVPDLTEDSETVLRLVYEEVCLRQEHEPGSTLDVVQRFPRWRQELEALLDCHSLLRA